MSLAQIFDRPLRGREFFEEVIRNNLDLGRPDRVQLIFDRVVTKKTPGNFRTWVILLFGNSGKLLTEALKTRLWKPSIRY